MEEINLSELFQIFWKRKVQIIIIVLIFFIIGGIYTFKLKTPKYSSTITMILVSNNVNSGINTTITSTDIALNAKLITTYSELIKSKTVLKEVLENLKLDIDLDKLKNDITVQSITNTELIEVTVTNEDKQLAAKIAEEIANIFQAKVKQLYNINNIQLMNGAQINNEPSNINYKNDILLFSIVGIVTAICYAIISDILDTTVKGQETIEKEFNLPVLTSIPVLRIQ